MENNRETLRKMKKNKRKNVVFLQKAGVLALFLAVIAAGVYGFNQLPGVKINKFLKEAQVYQEARDYGNALASYEKVLTIESGTVKAYRYMANLYLDMEDYQAAEEILYKGLEETQDKEIQETWLTVKYNESVNELNEERADFYTVERLLEILENDEEKASVYELMETCYNRLLAMTDEEGINSILISDQEGFGYEAYQKLVEKMLSLYQKSGKDELKQQLINYTGLQAEKLAFTPEDMLSYKELVKKVDEALGSDELKQLLGCLEKHTQIDALFSPLLQEFEAGNYEVARDFLVSDEYVAIRNAFIEETMEYWQGETYIPVSGIGVYLHYADGNWGFSYMDEEDEVARQGYIKVWGFKWLDNGHQRTALSYVPVSEGDEYYPLTEYCMMYWWSTPVNMELTVDTYARMNFRFEENTYTEEGKTTRAINDWGGKYEYKDTYE
ncbi:MAG: tetratricopeptide repeat protein [Lachnospiraceae bacterium]|nr:tetratricopeptide repeat protein [Lachnospiraceae bacterium]